MSNFWLVTGGAGFIGTHLCRALNARGDNVRVLDNLSNSNRFPPDVEAIDGDVTDPRDLRDALEGVDGCFHLAAVQPNSGNVDRCRAFSTNVGSMVALLNAASLSAVFRVVYASSAAIYGNAECRVREAAYPKPISAYGAEKLSAEVMASVGNCVHATGLRLFNVYGAGCHGVVAGFRNSIVRGEPVNIRGDGRQTRDFIHVSDAVAALVAAIGVEWPGALNVCTGVPTSILGLAGMMAAIAKKPLTVWHVPERAGDIRYSSGSPDLSRRVLGLGEPMALSDGLAAYLSDSI